MEGKTLFVKANTGPSGHGMPSAAGQALALKRAVKLVLEGPAAPAADLTGDDQVDADAAVADSAEEEPATAG